MSRAVASTKPEDPCTPGDACMANDTHWTHLCAKHAAEEAEVKARWAADRQRNTTPGE